MGDLFQIIENLQAVLPAFDLFLTLLFFLIGLIMVILSLSRMGKLAQGSSARINGLGGPLVTMIIGVFFVGWSSFLAVGSGTIFGTTEIQSSSEIFAYAPTVLGFAEEGSRTRDILVALTYIIQFIGLIAIARSLFLFNETAQGTGQSRLGAGFTFLIAGILAVNFPLFLGMVEALVGAPI